MYRLEYVWFSMENINKPLYLSIREFFLFINWYIKTTNSSNSSKFPLEFRHLFSALGIYTLIEAILFIFDIYIYLYSINPAFMHTEMLICCSVCRFCFYYYYYIVWFCFVFLVSLFFCCHKSNIIDALTFIFMQ